MRKTEIIIDEIRQLVTSKGYIYALCMILFEDFHIVLEQLHKLDYRKRLSTNEASLLLGFFIQKKIEFAPPETPLELIQLKQKTYGLMEELHQSFNIPFIEKLEKSLEAEHNIENYRSDQKEFFGKGDMLIEAIFYSGSGVYDFQYSEFLERKYKYDKEWLSKNRKFSLTDTPMIVSQIKHILQEKSEKVHLYGLNEKLPELIEKMKKKKPTEDWEKQARDILPLMEIHQYVELFFEHVRDKENLTMEDIREDGWKSFYQSLIELFIVERASFGNESNIQAFLDNFSISPEDGVNFKFQTIGDYNLINSHPIIKLDNEKYFVPITFLLFEAIYECPYYWMSNDKEYLDQAAENRGRVGEEVTYAFLAKVFGVYRAHKSVKIKTTKGHESTDIDVLCVLGSKALCVQVKSKKLTLLSRKGNDKGLIDDFQKAVQDAYEQGLVSRQKILEKKAKFIDENGNEIILSEGIDEVYLMVVSTENYPSLTHQSHIMLDKKDDEPFPIVLTIFDLELLAYYLNDPYDFLYYIKQRIALMDYFLGEEEMVFLGYHLTNKLWKIPKCDQFLIDTSYGKLIDRNYYPVKAGIEVSDEGDAIKKKWKNEDYDHLCQELKSIYEPKITDILFYLSDNSGKARDDLVNFILKTKQKTFEDQKAHDFSLPPDNRYLPRVGFSYFSLNSDNSEELKSKLLTLCQVRKYKSKGDVWIGFGSLKNSSRMIDTIAFNDEVWKYDESLEKLAKLLLEGKGQYLRLTKKMGRNDPCSCGSGLKYKNCCGAN
ncbi:MAG: SEC-C domain-containing protein [Ignavibacteriae bacterium]|nr:SEC-C domain-containing protein [Ignavibacteriota bacterium]